MRVESRIFELLTIFFFVVGTIYLVISREPAGSAALFLTGGLSLKTTRVARSPTVRATSASSRREATGP